MSNTQLVKMASWPGLIDKYVGRNQKGSRILLKMFDLKFPVVLVRLSKAQREEAKSLLQPGDILLEDNCSLPFGQVTNRLAGSRWAHAAFYIGDGTVVDIGTKPSVSKVPLEQFLKTTDLAICRPRYKTREDLASVISFLRRNLGRPFNKSFDLNRTDSFYCAQLISSKLAQMPNPIELRTSTLFGHTVMVSGAVENSREISRVWMARHCTFTRIACHCPTFISMIAGAWLGNRLGIVGSVCGAAAGLAMIVKITNHFAEDKMAAYHL